MQAALRQGERFAEAFLADLKESFEAARNKKATGMAGIYGKRKERERERRETEYDRVVEKEGVRDETKEYFPLLFFIFYFFLQRHSLTRFRAVCHPINSFDEEKK